MSDVDKVRLAKYHMTNTVLTATTLVLRLGTVVAGALVWHEGGEVVRAVAETSGNTTPQLQYLMISSLLLTLIVLAFVLRMVGIVVLHVEVLEYIPIYIKTSSVVGVIEFAASIMAFVANAMPETSVFGGVDNTTYSLLSLTYEYRDKRTEAEIQYNNESLLEPFDQHEPAYLIQSLSIVFVPLELIGAVLTLATIYPYIRWHQIIVAKTEAALLSKQN